MTFENLKTPQEKMNHIKICALNYLTDVIYDNMEMDEFVFLPLDVLGSGQTLKPAPSEIPEEFIPAFWDAVRMFAVKQKEDPMMVLAAKVVIDYHEKYGEKWLEVIEQEQSKNAVAMAKFVYAWYTYAEKKG